MRPDALFLMVVKRPHQDIDAFQRPQESFYHGQVFIAPHRLLGGQPCTGLAGADHGDAVKLCFPLDRGGAARLVEHAVVNLHLEVFGHPGVAQHWGDVRDTCIMSDPT
jgi:hypothetical protein